MTRRGDLQRAAGQLACGDAVVAGFPTGLKWNLTRKVQSEVKYIICNGDEGDPARSWTARFWKVIRMQSSRAC